ncbi:acyl-CoA thioesterase II [Pseudonocardia sp.]|jgi:acyl-CoA thioesterase-2|uniref:acyl-CoA thioesterase n=1 Tax=Pseudonocardia sp. TaxID=60912 RepID=UPI002622136C|nr:acyl-CoA thioesterase II [Pseudonocardia sp.]MCW2717865.1 Acyl-CoA thioesterase [Pseudonocardia sp.]MDT7616262.1 acyl-CoA thioesterase [Pseudonocardiales bacterium]
MTMSVAAMMDLEQIEVDLFRGTSQWPPSQRVFGGEVAAQALVAAGRTVPKERMVHFLHAYFLRPGDASVPIVYRVEPIRDGRSYTTRRVTAQQHGEVTFTLSASFHLPEDGFTHQIPQLVAPPPEALPDPDPSMAGGDELTRAWFSGLADRHPFELRFDGELPRVATGRGERVAPRQRFWLRCRETLPDEQLVHSCAATYASDMLLLSTSVALHGTMFGAPDVQFASLDHAVWFHGPFHADEWLYYDQESSWADGGRALCQGRMFDRSGRLVVSVMQEGMIRRR